MKLSTPAQDILRHRLDVPDAIADALALTLPVSEDACDRLKGIIGGEFTLSALNPIDRCVLLDAAQGSTYLCDLDDAVAAEDITQGRRTALLRAARELETALGVAVPRQ